MAVLVGGVSAQKALKPVRAYIKAKNGNEAMKLVENLEKDSIIGRLPQLYDLGKEAQMLKNDVENEKIYLKQAYDTAQFFNTTMGIYEYILKCDREEQRLLAEEGKKIKFQKKNSGILHRYYTNLSAGGRYFYSKKDYATAMKFFSLYLDVPRQPVWGIDKSVMTTRPYIVNAYLYEKCAFLSKNYDQVGRYEDITLNDTLRQRRSSIEYLALSSLALNDTVRYHQYLVRGLTDYPNEAFFFTHLADFHAGRGEYKTVLSMADERLQRDSADIVALVAKSLALMNTHEDAAAIDVAKRCLAIDSTLVEAYFYVGAAYCNLALNVALPTNINSSAYRNALSKQKNYYSSARPYMEKYRALAPDEKKKWAPLLYRIYFSLNLGKQFEEINEITKTIR